jgi:hypothetical protein
MNIQVAQIKGILKYTTKFTRDYLSQRAIELILQEQKNQFGKPKHQTN